MNAIAVAIEVEHPASFGREPMFECPILPMSKPRATICRPSMPRSGAPRKGLQLESTFEPEHTFVPEIRSAAPWLIFNAA